MEFVSDLFFDYTLRTVALGSATLGVVSGALGSYAVLRRQSLMGDAISHAALPGIALAFLLTGSKATLVLIVGAALAGWLGTLCILAVVRTTKIKYDTSLGLILSVFFGVGLVLLTFIQKRPDAAQAGLERFLFGQAATMLASDVLTMAALGLLALFCVGTFWKEFKLLSFDPDYGGSIGFPMRFLDVLLTSLLVIAIVIGLQTVGVVLMSAMLIAPAAAARQWTDRFGRMVALAALFGAASGVTGALVSSTTERMPTGPTIVICATAIVVFSLLFASNRGVLWRWIQDRRSRSRLRTEAVLCDLFSLASQHPDPHHPHSAAALRAMSGGHGGVAESLRALEARKWVTRKGADAWALTEAGVQEARRLLKERNGERPDRV